MKAPSNPIHLSYFLSLHMFALTTEPFGDFTGKYIDRDVVAIWCLGNIKRRSIVLFSSCYWCSIERSDFEGASSGNPFDLVFVPDKDFVCVELCGCDVEIYKVR